MQSYLHNSSPSSSPLHIGLSLVSVLIWSSYPWNSVVIQEWSTLVLLCWHDLESQPPSELCNCTNCIVHCALWKNPTVNVTEYLQYTLCSGEVGWMYVVSLCGEEGRILGWGFVINPTQLPLWVGANMSIVIDRFMNIRPTDYKLLVTGIVD